MLTLTRVPVVAGRAYIERARRQPASFVATLVPQEGHRYFPHAIAVTVGGETLGYIAPEVAREWYEPMRAAQGPLTCPARRASITDRETSGVELLLDFSSIALAGLQGAAEK